MARISLRVQTFHLISLCSCSPEMQQKKPRHIFRFYFNQQEIIANFLLALFFINMGKEVGEKTRQKTT